MLGADGQFNSTSHCVFDTFIKYAYGTAAFVGTDGWGILFGYNFSTYGTNVFIGYNGKVHVWHTANSGTSWVKGSS